MEMHMKDLKDSQIPFLFQKFSSLPGLGLKRHNHTFFFMCTGSPRQDPLVVHYLMSTLSLGVGTCHALTCKLASPPVLPRCVFTFSIFLYLLCPLHPSLSSFCKFSQEFHSQFRIHLLLHFYTTLIRMQNIGVFVRSCECYDVSHI